MRRKFSSNFFENALVVIGMLCMVLFLRYSDNVSPEGSHSPRTSEVAGEEKTRPFSGSSEGSVGEEKTPPSSSPAEAAGEEKTHPSSGSAAKILVIETTDIHGYLVDISWGDPDRFQYRLARIAQDVEDARASGEYDDVLLLDGGDIYQGTPVSNMTQGASMRAALDAMDYDAVALGNHEFDWDVTAYGADEDATLPPYEIGEFKGDPDIPVLACDLYDAGSGKRVSFTKDYVMLEKAGRQIAVIGYIPNYRGSIMREKITPYAIKGSLEKLDARVREINEKEQPDATVVLAHEEPWPVADAMDPEQVDLVLGGHSHQIAADVADNGIPYLQGRCYSQGYASAVLVIDSEGNVSVEDIKYTDITEDREALYDNEENAEHLDDTIMDISYTAWSAVWEDMSEVLGYIDTPVLSKYEQGTSSGGNWITGLMLRATRSWGTQIAFYNAGGIRSNFKIPRGETKRPITIYDVYTIAPFGNTLLVYDLTGKELAQQLVNGLKNGNYGDQITGLTFTYTATGDDNMDRRDREYTILSITLDDGTEVDLTDKKKTYRVCTTDYSATLYGSVFAGKEPLYPASEAPVDHEAFVEALREEATENDGYITVDTRPRAIETR